MPSPEPRQPPQSQAALADVIERNIVALLRLRQQTANRRDLQARIADGINAFSGRMRFIYLHVAWFGGWIFVNTGWGGLPVFDPFPYGLLTMVVSLEAIFLSTFVLISQNRLSAEADRRADLDLHIGLLTEHEVTRVLQMLDAIQQHLGITNHSQSELAQLEVETKPEDVLAEIRRLERSVLEQQSAEASPADVT